LRTTCEKWRLHSGDSAGEELGWLPPPRDWRQAIAQLKEGFQLCKECSALPLLQKDLGLISSRSGDLKNGLAELLEAQELASQGADIEQAIRMIRSPREARSPGSQR
jgi:hypothetical protein